MHTIGNPLQDWWRTSTVYQVYPKSFNDTTGRGTGDIRGLMEKLDYIKGLGINIVWLQPVYVSPQNDNGYDVAEYCSVDPAFGTMEDFDELVAELKKRNMHLMIDIVVNHSSTEHPWFKEARTSRDNRYRDYYIWRDPGTDGGPPNNWKSKFGGPAWQYDEGTGQYYLTLFDKTQADLNWENEKVREEVVDILRFWADKGVSGFRMDVINLISKDPDFPDDDGSVSPGDGRKFYTDGPRVHEYIKELNEKVFKPYNLVTVGEMSSTTLEHCIRYSNPKENEFSMTFNFHHLKVDYPNGQKWELKPYDFEELKKVLSDWQTGMQQGGGWNALFWNNHDQPRALTRFTDDEEYRTESAKMLATTLHGLQGTPYVYQGEEIGMPDPKWNDMSEFRDIESLNMYEILQQQGKTPEEAAHIVTVRSRDNSRLPIPWNDGHQAGFTTGTPWIKIDERYPLINAQAQVEDPHSIYHHYRQLIELRKNLPVLTDGEYVRLDQGHPEVYAYARRTQEQTLIVISNFSSRSVSYELPPNMWGKPDMASAQLLIRNTTEQPELAKVVKLQPYASYMWLIETN
ncbi:alpha,alpha-phosphotrehalase [Paenibacillus glucanolyticus]|jgi:trehalose-6-phosphate hydrolase|uniref:alpha,alpha-phosphotrehalase n=1 Tax=Paenibacillus TaxID=44249 RepID=UPI0003E27799|nr:MULTISPECIES: alpha,alpha-phosphotrehalase [Paenibacillus]ANA82486.1 alpha,alpha-phosphotrehalase [Paenibacillus glucanolyticus]AVV58772.1 alpha,alpha-phosphotrehalase [Paenibacillus glucanolyticus]ETT33802.1 alpha,alpha-phosphotrehalase [Paenibacillus sp. FSL R5-808]MPY17266.1 alpha,alpha-phosphotrehalase [Paenibacillus glucanolyticus]OMF80131.1 alpha,alpha-phosphotrehalase [Paenibacillus glucanolyticus]